MVQSYLGAKITSIINESYNTNITVKKIDLSFLGNIELKDVQILDHHKDSLIYVKNLSTSIFSYKNIINNKLQFKKVNIEGAILNIKTYKGEKEDNLNIFVDKLDDGKPSGSVDKFLLTATKINLKNAVFSLTDENTNKEPIVKYSGIGGDLYSFKVYGTSVYADIKNMYLKDKNDVVINKLSTLFTYTEKNMLFNNLAINTKTSAIKGNIAFNYNTDDFSDFENKVKIKANFVNSKISLADLHKFYAEFGKNGNIRFSTTIKGTLNNFTLHNLNLTDDKKTKAQGNFSLKNIFLKNYNIDSKIKYLSSNYEFLKQLLPNILGKKLPAATKMLGEFNIKGNVLVTNKTIKTDIILKSSIGEAKSKLLLNNFQDTDNVLYKGDIDIVDANLGKIVGDKLMGKLSMKVKVKGKSFTKEIMNTSVTAAITKYQYKNYTYKNLFVNGTLKQQQLYGNLKVDDKNIKLTFKGLADFSKSVNKYNFLTHVDYSDFNKLNLFKRDSISVLKGDIDIKLRGNSINDLLGDINFKNGSYYNQKKKYLFKEFNIKSSISKGIKKVTFNSTDIINGKIEGHFKYDELGLLARNYLVSVFINYKLLPVTKGQNVKFKFNIYNKIIDVFFPQIKFGKNTFIKGSIIPDKNDFKLTFKSPNIHVYKNIIKSIRLQVDNKNPLYNTILTVKNIESNRYKFNNLNLVNITLKDTLFLRTNFYGGDSFKNKYNLSFYSTINKEGRYVIGVKKSSFNFDNATWFINPEGNKKNKIIFNESMKKVSLQTLKLVSGKQLIELEGKIDNTDNEKFSLKVNNVPLNNIVPKIDSLELKGLVNGNFNLKKQNGSFLPFANFTINNFKINDIDQGNLYFRANGENSYKNYNIDVLLQDKHRKSLQAFGTVYFKPKKPTIDLSISLDNFKLNSFSPLGEDVLSHIRGLAFGSVNVTGLLENPDLSGTVYLKKAGLAFSYLNVDYDFEGTPTINLNKQSFSFLPLTLIDNVNHTKGILSGTISHRKFKEWFLNFDLKTKRLLVLNTKEEENSLFYGTAYIAGESTIKGSTDNLAINVTGTTLKGTKFIIPLSDVRTIDESNLVRFVTKNEKENKLKVKEGVTLDNASGLSLNFNLNVTKDAIAQIVVDKKTGSILRGSGDGKLYIDIDTNGKFNMFGDFKIDNGIYKFKNIINKTFTVKKGGTITWNGNPYDADLNIEAIYKTKANPAVLLENVEGNRKVDIDLITKITGKLYESNLAFDVQIPNSSSLVNSELQFKLNDNDKKMTQFFSLLTTGSFIDTDNVNFNGNSAIAGSISEEISSVISDIFSSNGDKFQVGVNYDLGGVDKLNNLKLDDQLEISVSSKFSRKFTINGRVGVPVGANTQSSIVGEVEIESPLNKKGTLKAKVFNRQNEIQFSVADEEGYTQGFGISYTVAFDTLKELLEKLGLKKAKPK